MSQRVGGTNPGTYLGVNALTPPNFRQVNRAPTINDTKTFRLGDIWQQTNTENFWILAKLSATQASPNVQVADWVKIANGSLAVYTLTGNTGGAVGVDGANNINVVGDGTTITVAGNPGTHTLTISTVGSGVVESLVGDDNIPVTPLLGAIDVLGTPLGGSSVAFTGATPHELRLNVTDANDNTIIGLVAGNNPNTGQRNTGLGKAALADITSGTDNTCIGAGAGFNITSGSKNTTVGEFSLGGGATTASNNAVIGYHAGINYTTSESSNILIGNDGVVADNNTIRIGTNGGGAGQQNRCFVAGVDGVNVGSTATVVTEVGNQLGTAVITAGAGVTVTPGANTITIAATGSVPSYTHGTWTPTITFGGGSTGITYVSNVADYIQIGQLVFVNYHIVLSSKGSSTGLALLNGFPFSNTGAVVHNHCYSGALFLTFDAGYTYMGLAMSGNQAAWEEYGSGQNVTQLTDANFANNTTIFGTFCYSTGVL